MIDRVNCEGRRVLVKEEAKRGIKLGCAAAGALVAALLIATCPIPGLSYQATAVLGILIMAIVWWITGVLPEFVTAVVMAVLFVVVAGISVGATFSTFASSTWWLLLSAFTLGVGMKTSGLMRRIALAIVRKFPRTFRCQVIAQLVTGTVLGPLIPSLAVKGAMLAPLAMSIGDELGYERQGKRATGLFAAMLVGIRTVAPTIVSASVTGYALMDSRRDEAESSAVESSRGGTNEGDSKPIPDGIGPLSAVEKRMLAIILMTVVLWATEPFHHISAMAVGLAALVAMFVLKVIDVPAFKSGVNWTSLLFIGIALGLGSVFAEAGLNDWVMQTCGPAFQALAGNPYLLVLGIGVITVVLRFLIVSEVAYLNLLMAFLVPMAASVGVNPWVLGFSAYALVIAWFAKYQSPIYLAAFYAVDGKMAKHSELAKYCGVYLATCLAGLVVCVPYWQWMGLL